MNSNFNENQIEAYAAAFEEGDAIWCDGKWWKVSKLTRFSQSLTCEAPNQYVIRCYDGEVAIDGFREEEKPYRVTTLTDYKLQGGEKLVWLGNDDVNRVVFGKVYDTFIDGAGDVVYTNENYMNIVPEFGDWAVIPKYKQVKKNEESKFKKGDKVLVNGFIDGTIVEVLGNQKYLVSIVYRSGMEERNEFNEYQLELTMEEPPAPKVVDEQSSSNEIALDEVAIHSEIITRLVKQTIKGVKKYGDPVQHDNLSTVEWIDHAIDESVDQIVYLTALKHSLLSKEERNEVSCL